MLVVQLQPLSDDEYHPDNWQKILTIINQFVILFTYLHRIMCVIKVCIAKISKNIPFQIHTYKHKGDLTEYRCSNIHLPKYVK